MKKKIILVVVAACLFFWFFRLPILAEASILSASVRSVVFNFEGNLEIANRIVEKSSELPGETSYKIKSECYFYIMREYERGEMARDASVAEKWLIHAFSGYENLNHGTPEYFNEKERYESVRNRVNPE